MNSSDWKPPVSLNSAQDKQSFAFQSTVHRWPAILTQVIDAIYSANHALSYSRADHSAKIAEGKQIIEKVAALKHDISRDRPLETINVVQGQDQDDGPPTDIFDQTIQTEKWTWFSAPWLFAECYLYRLLRSFFGRSLHWKRYDPFLKQKLETFKSSGNAISALAVTIQDLVNKSLRGEQGPESTPQGRQILFHEMAQISLWGNATDLSLLTSLSYSDLQALQTTGKQQQEARAKFILANDLDLAWAKISSLQGGRVDFVLDNSGFELVSDMIFADWLLTTPHVNQVVFHPKNMPWFVSDVTPPDFRHTLEALFEPSFFSTDQQPVDLGSDRHRSVSRSRDLQADPLLYSFNSNTASSTSHPAGSRGLVMSDSLERGRSPHPAGSLHLQAREGSIDSTRGRLPMGSRNFQMDPAYFKNARSQTISPSRSYVIDSSIFSKLAIHDEREEEKDANNSHADQQHSRGRSTTIKDETPSSQTPIQGMVRRWMDHMDQGRFQLSVPLNIPLGSDTGRCNGFWTLPVSFANMQNYAPDLYHQLSNQSDLVIFKGDLNYRKLTSDANWPSTTEFRKALGPLAGGFNLLALRTNKADVCVGLQQGQEEMVSKQDATWRINGKWAVIQYCPKDD